MLLDQTGKGAVPLCRAMCADGGGWCELDGAHHEVSPNRLLIIPPRLPHRYYADAQEPWSIWWLHVMGEDVPDLLAAIGLTPRAPTAPITDPYRAFGQAESICDDMARDETSASLTAAAGTAWSLLAQLAVTPASPSRSFRPTCAST